MTRAVNLANAGGGTVLQVVTIAKTDTWASTAFSSRTWQDVTGVAATITPTSANSKILVNCLMMVGSQNTYNAVGARITRNGAVTLVGDAAGSRAQAFWGSDDWYAGTYNTQQIVITFVDTPASTSALTYQAQLLNDRQDSEVVLVNRTYSDGNSTQTYRGVSTITLMEIAG